MNSTARWFNDLIAEYRKPLLPNNSVVERFLVLPSCPVTRSVFRSSFSVFLFHFCLLTTTLSAQSFSIPAHKAQLGELHYSARVGSTVVTEGDSFRVMVVPDGGVLQSVQVSVAGSVVHSLRFVFVDAQGEAHTTNVGPDDGDWQPPFEIPADRLLVGISGAGGWWIDAVRFHLDDGTTSPRYGGTGGDTECSLRLARRNDQWKGRLMGFWGTAGEHVESLGLVFWPIE